MKILHLVCNSHIDPVWQWDWDEGASTALATFYTACELLNKYDFVFCHNEVLLYEYIEKYDPALFERIKEHVKNGKWKIMGGWYIQPDCLVPSGESLIRQCTLGREYFATKFNTRPVDAINFDSFGHTRGIPSILKKCGFTSYTFCRPMPFHNLYEKEDLPLGPFLWKGYDGSTVKALRYVDASLYSSERGKAKDNILRKAKVYEELDSAPILWGIGNHGGLASQKDLEDIIVLQDEKKGDYKILHSSLEEYFKNEEPTKVVDKQLICLMKSYSSCHPIKLVHDQLENALYFTEKVCSMADMLNKYEYNKKVLKDAEKVLCQIEFHDVLSGTAIERGTFSSIRKAYGAIDSLKKEMYGAFSSLALTLPKVNPGDDNLVFINPHPYPFDGYVEASFFMEKIKFWPEKEHNAYVLYDEHNKNIPYQLIQTESNLNYDRPKRLVIKLHMEPSSIKSLGVHHILTTERLLPNNDEKDIIIKDNIKEVIISRQSGLIKSFNVQGKEYLSNESFAPVMFNDNEDPWGWNLTNFDHDYSQDGYPLENDKKKHFYEMKCDHSGNGPYQGLKGVRIIEQGSLYTEVEALFKRNESYVIHNYKIYKDSPYIDIKTRVIWNEPKKGLKMRVSLKGSSSYFAQMAFGQEKYKNNGLEYPTNRYVGNMNENNPFVIYNKSAIHSASKKGKNLFLTLLNGSMYCAHPLGKGTDIVIDRNRYLSYIETGTHEFNFRVGVNKIEECERISQEFNEPIYGVSFFPHGEGNKEIRNIVSLSNPNISMVSLRKGVKDDYIIRLYNGTNKSSSTELIVLNHSIKVSFKKYEFKTFILYKEKIKESNDSSIY